MSHTRGGGGEGGGWGGKGSTPEEDEEELGAAAPAAAGAEGPATPLTWAGAALGTNPFCPGCLAAAAPAAAWPARGVWSFAGVCGLDCFAGLLLACRFLTAGKVEDAFHKRLSVRHSLQC